MNIALLYIFVNLRLTNDTTLLEMLVDAEIGKHRKKNCRLHLIFLGYYHRLGSLFARRILLFHFSNDVTVTRLSIQTSDLNDKLIICAINPHKLL